MCGSQRALLVPRLNVRQGQEGPLGADSTRAVIVASITDLERLRLSHGPGPLFVVMSRERAKLSYRWLPAVVERWATVDGRLVRDEETLEPFRVPCCPDCFGPVVDRDGLPLAQQDA